MDIDRLKIEKFIVVYGIISWQITVMIIYIFFYFYINRTFELLIS